MATPGTLATRAMALGIRFVAFHNEQSAGYAASADSYLTGRPGVYLTVFGLGCVHGLAGISNAAANAWPAVMISGSCDQKDFGKGDFQMAPYKKVRKVVFVHSIPKSPAGKIVKGLMRNSHGDSRM